MWLGFSLFGFYNLNEKFFVRLWRHCMNERPQQQQQQQNTTEIDNDNDRKDSNQRSLPYIRKRSKQFSEENHGHSNVSSNTMNNQKQNESNNIKKSTIRRIPISKRRIFQNIIHNNNNRQDGSDDSDNSIKQSNSVLD